MVLHEIKKKIKKFILLSLWVLCLSPLFFSGHALAEEVLWEFDVPVHLSKMPQSAQSFKVIWTMFDYDAKEIGDGRTAREPIVNGTYHGTVPVDIFDSDLEDPSQAVSCVFSFVLSQDDFQYYHPFTPGKSWTYPKKGSTVVHMVMVENLQGDLKNSVWTA